MTEQTEKPSALEKHAQTTLGVIATAILLWVGTTLTSQQTQIALLQQSLDTLTKRVEIFTAQPRFSKEDFHLEMRLYENRIRLIETELQRRSEFMANTDQDIRKIKRHVGVD